MSFGFSTEAIMADSGRAERKYSLRIGRKRSCKCLLLDDKVEDQIFTEQLATKRMKRKRMHLDDLKLIRYTATTACLEFDKSLKEPPLEQEDFNISDLSEEEGSNSGDRLRPTQHHCGRIFQPKTLIEWPPSSLSHFDQLTGGDFSFVDKSRMIINLLNSSRKSHLIVRPPGFGKTLNLGMLSSYFSRKDKGAQEQDKTLFDMMYVNEFEPAREHRDKYYVININLGKVGGSTLNEFQQKWRQLLSDVIWKTPIEYNCDLSFESMIGKSQCADSIIILIDNFDAPFLKFYQDLDNLRCMMRNEFSFISCRAIKYVIATSVIPETYGISFENVDMLKKSIFTNCFGFEELEVLLLLKAKEGKVRLGDSLPLREKYGNYYCNSSDPVNATPLLYNPRMLIHHLATDSEYKITSMRDSDPLIFFLNMMRSLPVIPDALNWPLIFLRKNGCCHSRKDFLLDNVPNKNYLQSLEFVYSLAVYTGLAEQYVLSSGKSSNDEYTLITPNKMARKFLVENGTDEPLSSGILDALKEGLLNNKIGKIISGFKKLLFSAPAISLPANAAEREYGLYAYGMFLCLPIFITCMEFEGDTSGTMDIIIIIDRNRRYYILEFKKARDLENKSDLIIRKQLEKYAKEGYEQIIKKGYAHIEEKLATLKIDVPENVTLIGIGLFKKYFGVHYVNTTRTDLSVNKQAFLKINPGIWKEGHLP